MTPRWEVVEGEALDMLHTLHAGSVDAVVTDPPYCSGGTTSAERTQLAPSGKYVTTGCYVAGPEEFAGDNRDQRSFILWSTLWLSAARRASRPGAMLVVFSDWRQVPATSDAVQAAGWVWRGTAVWAKPVPGGRPRRGAFRNQAEYLIWATNGRHRPRDDGPYLPGVIQATAPRSHSRVHVTQKPVELMETLVQVAPPDGLVLDPFTGSGTTGIAAVRAGRRFLGIELVPAYAAIARDRIRAAATDTDRSPQICGADLV